jgi:hypothetical protein
MENVILLSVTAALVYQVRVIHQRVKAQTKKGRKWGHSNNSKKPRTWKSKSKI